MIGIINRFKNQNFLIEIAKKLPEVTFLLVGEGPDRMALEQNSKELINVILTGKREDAYKFYSALIFLHFHHFMKDSDGFD